MCTDLNFSFDRIEATAKRRKLFYACLKTLSEIHSKPAEAVENHIRDVVAIDAPGGHGNEAVPASEVTVVFNTHLSRLKNNKGELSGLKTGLDPLDLRLDGLQPGNVINLGARPGMGKAALGVNIACNVARAGKPVLIFSAELTRLELMARIIAGETGINLAKFRGGDFSPDDWQAITGASGRVYDWPLFIDDSSNLHVREVVRRSPSYQLPCGG